MRENEKRETSAVDVATRKRHYGSLEWRAGSLSRVCTPPVLHRPGLCGAKKKCPKRIEAELFNVASSGTRGKAAKSWLPNSTVFHAREERVEVAPATRRCNASRNHLEVHYTRQQIIPLRRTRPRRMSHALHLLASEDLTCKGEESGK